MAVDDHSIKVMTLRDILLNFRCFKINDPLRCDPCDNKFTQNGTICRGEGGGGGEEEERKLRVVINPEKEQTRIPPLCYSCVGCVSKYVEAPGKSSAGV